MTKRHEKRIPSLLFGLCVSTQLAIAQVSTDASTISAVAPPNEASAFFRFADPQGCMVAAVLVGAVRDVQGPPCIAELAPSERSLQATVGLTLLLEDICTGEQFVRGSSLNRVPASAVMVSGSMSFAKVSARGFRFENQVTQSLHDVAIDVTWESVDAGVTVIGGNPNARAAVAKGSAIIETDGTKREMISEPTFAAFMNRSTVAACSMVGTNPPLGPGEASRAP